MTCYKPFRNKSNLPAGLYFIASDGHNTIHHIQRWDGHIWPIEIKMFHYMESNLVSIIRFTLEMS